MLAPLLARERSTGVHEVQGRGWWLLLAACLIGGGANQKKKCGGVSNCRDMLSELTVPKSKSSRPPTASPIARIGEKPEKRSSSSSPTASPTIGAPRNRALSPLPFGAAEAPRSLADPRDDANSFVRKCPSRHHAATSLSQIVVMDNQQYYDLLQSDVRLNDLNWSEPQQVDFDGPEQSTPPVKTSSNRQKNFSVLEDEALVDAYLEISQDPVIGVDQPRACYWKRVHEYFHANKKEESDRTQSSLQHRWAVIQEQVNMFCACYAQILNRNQSGMTQKDKVTQACIKYREDDKGKKSFGLMHCYEQLEKAEKWTSRLTHKKQKTTSMATPGSSAVSSNASEFKDEATSPPKDVPTTRPIGKKAAKELLRRGKSSTSTGSSSVMEAFGGMLSAREAKRQERFDLAIVMDQQIEEQRLVEERKKTAIEEKRVALEEEKIQLKRMMEERQIINIDLSGMDEQQQEYYKMRRSQIINAHRNSSG